MPDTRDLLTLNRRLRQRISPEAAILLLPGAPNALTARVLEDAHVAAIRDAVDVALVVDADTGFGNAVNVQRTVRVLERAGANAVQLEDQIAPKRCGHFDGKGVIDVSEMIGKIHAAVDARTDDDLVLIARTDARAEFGLDAACDRAAAYLAAGADVAFVEAPRNRPELAAIEAQVPGAHVANMVEGGKTPLLPLAELGELGFSMALYANTALRAAISGMQRAASHLGEHGDSIGLVDDIASWQVRQDLVRKPEFDRLNARYGGGPVSPVPVSPGPVVRR